MSDANLGFPPRAGAAASSSGGARGRLLQGPQLHKVAPMTQQQQQQATNQDGGGAVKQSSLLVDKSTLKVNLPNGGFNLVKFGDATDIKVRGRNQQIELCFQSIKLVV